MKGLAVIIVNYRTAKLAIESIAALASERAAIPELQVVVVDGASGDGSAEEIAAAIAARGWGDWVTLLPLAVNGGFAFANNQALALLAARSDAPEAIALVNPDARVTPGALETMRQRLAAEPRAGAVGGSLIHEDGGAQASAFNFPSLRGEFCRGAGTGVIERLLRQPPTVIYADAAREVSWVTGAAVMFRTEALADVGIFDEGFFLYFEETELMRRLHRGGWTVWHEPSAKVVHHAGVATQIRDPKTGLARSARMPDYWYDSRRRFFALAHGRCYATAAGLAWLAGHAIFRLRRTGAAKRGEMLMPSARGFVSRGLWAKRRDAMPAVQRLDAPANARPAWMER